MAYKTYIYLTKTPGISIPILKEQLDRAHKKRDLFKSLRSGEERTRTADLLTASQAL